MSLLIKNKEHGARKPAGPKEKVTDGFVVVVVLCPNFHRISFLKASLSDIFFSYQQAHLYFCFLNLWVFLFLSSWDFQWHHCSHCYLKHQ